MTDLTLDTAGIEAKTEDYARGAVPEAQAIGAIRIAMILIGMTIALPAFILGSTLGSGLGFDRMILACFGGGGILALVAVASALAGARSRLSTYLLIAAAFGRTGGGIANAVIGISLLGWFGVIMMMFGRSAAQIVGQAGSAHVVLIWAGAGAVLMVVSAIVGFRAIDRLSSVLTPAKAILLTVAAGTALYRYGGAALLTAPVDPPMPIGTGVTLVVGSLIIGAAVSPDMTRYARSPVQAAVAAGLVYGLAFPLVLLLAGLPSILMHESDLVTIMVALGLGIPAIGTVLLAAWTNNTYNLYASSLVLSTLMVRQPRWRLTLAVGVIGTAFGLLGISEQMIPYLVILSVIMPPIAGVYLAHYYLSPSMPASLDEVPAWRWQAALAWAIGAGFAGFETIRGFALVGLPALDSLILSAVAYFVLKRLSRR